MNITTENLKLEVEAEAPRNRVIFGQPTKGQNSDDLHNYNTWISKNSSTRTLDASIRSVTFAKTSAPAAQIIGSSPDYTATPGEVWGAVINTHSNQTFVMEVEALNGTTSLGIMTSITHLASGNPRATGMLFLTPPNTTRVRFNVKTAAADNYSVRVRTETFIGRGPAQLNDWITSNSVVSLANNLSGYTVTPTSSSSPQAYQSKPVVPGQWSTAAADVIGGRAIIRLTFRNSTGSQTQNIDSPMTGPGNRATTPTAQAPSWATTVRVIALPLNASGGTPALTDVLTITDVVLNIEDKQIFAERSTWEESTRPNNLIRSSSGELGSVGWETPLSNSRLKVVTEGGTQRLRFIFAGDRPMYLWSEPQPVTPGRWLGASWNVQTRWGYRQSLDFLDAGLNVVSSTPQTKILNLNGTTFATPIRVPTNANYARIRFDFYYDTLIGVDPPDGPDFPGYHTLREVVLAEGDTAERASGLPAIESFKWLNIIKPSHEISINRADLDVGTLTAKITDPDLDPAQAPDVRPGKRVRVMAKTPSGVWESLYTGIISNAETAYEDGTEITLTAADGIKQLANSGRSFGVRTVAELPAVLEGTGVAYRVNGSTDQILTFTTVATNDNASALDQVAVTRDTALGYAWVDRNNFMIVNDASQMSTSVVGIIDETAYRAPEANFNTAECINEVVVKFLRYNATAKSTEEVIYGPYRDATSIAKFGRYASEFTIQGTENATSIKAYAQAILTANSKPRIRINTATVPITDTTGLSTSRALIDLYDLVTVKYAAKGINENARVTGISHSIRPGHWDMTLDFGVDGAVAAAQLTPSASTTNGAGTTVNPQSGYVLITPSGSNTPTSERINFPIPYPEAPQVVVTPNTTVAGTIVTGTASTEVSRTGATIWVTRTSTTTTGLRWIAVL